MKFVSRKEWGALPPRSSSTISGVDGVAFHWGGPAVPKVHDDHRHCAPAVRAWQRFHMNTRGWSDIAYNAIVCPHGYVFEGRGLDKRSAANGTNYGNGNFYAVCYLSGEGQSLTDEGKAGMMDAREWLMRGRTDTPVRAHRSFKSTGCPGDDIVKWIDAGCPTKPLALGDRVLGMGDEGDDVEALQALLGGLTVDGDFGPATNHAVIAFQKGAGLDADGLVGPETLSALRKSRSTPTPTAPETQEDDMRRARYTVEGASRQAQFLTDGIHTRWITDIAELGDLAALGLLSPLGTVSPETHAALILVGPDPLADPSEE